MESGPFGGGEEQAAGSIPLSIYAPVAADGGEDWVVLHMHDRAGCYVGSEPEWSSHDQAHLGVQGALA